MKNEINGWNRVYNHPDVIEYHKGNKKVELSTKICKGRDYVIYSAGLQLNEKCKTLDFAKAMLKNILMKN